MLRFRIIFVYFLNIYGIVYFVVNILFLQSCLNDLVYVISQSISHVREQL